MTRVWDPEVGYQDRQVATTYDSARFTSWSGRRGDHREKQAFRKALARISPVDTALDIPCGTGRMTEILLSSNLRVTGADISTEMMEQARHKLQAYGDQLELVRANLRCLPFPPDSFDVVTCIRLFGHYPSATRVPMLREMARVSRRWVVVQYGFTNFPIRCKRWIKRNLLRTYEGVVHLVTDDGISEELQDSGLVERDRYWVRYPVSEAVYIVASKGI